LANAFASETKHVGIAFADTAQRPAPRADKPDLNHVAGLRKRARDVRRLIEA